MASFKLPRLQANLPIVSGEGKPNNFFLRLFNIELAERIEKAITDQQEITDALAAQLLLIQAAQDRADAAYALAESAQGSRYIDFDGPYPSISGIINGQSADSILTYFGTVSGATLDADSVWNGTLTFSEDIGGAPVVIGSIPLVIPSNGDDVGGQWQTDPAPFNFSGTGTLAGSVTYTVAGAYVSGPNIVTAPTISVNLTTLPRAA